MVIIWMHIMVNNNLIKLMNIYKKNKKQDSEDIKRFQQNRVKPNCFKTLYHLNMKKKDKIISQFVTSNPVNLSENTHTQKSKCVQDSLENAQMFIQQKEKGHKQMQEYQSKRRSLKKWSHSRSQSCPFINPTVPSKQEIKHQKQPYVYHKFIVENQSKRTLKKSSTLHRKNQRLNQKYSIGNISQLSQESNTVIVHSLPIEHLSSMLYSLNQDKDHSFKKSTSTSRVPKQIFSIHTELYFQTRLQQQMKVYDLNQELKILHKETENVKIKQEVLQKLATKFQRQQGHTDEEDSLLIH